MANIYLHFLKLGNTVTIMSNYNGFAKTKAGWHFLFFAQTCRKLIKRTNVALAHNVEYIANWGLKCADLSICYKVN